MAAICEEEAIREIKALSTNGRNYLKCLLRDHIQTVSGAAEVNARGILSEAVTDFRHKLEKMGL